MSEQTPGPASASRTLPDSPNLDWLRKEAKRHLADLRTANLAAKLADAQFDVARQYGFASWRALKAHVESLSVDGQLFAAAESGDVGALTTLLDAHPDKLRLRKPPYEMTLLHLAAQHLPAVNLLLARGLDVNSRDKGDNTYAMHWAAAGGKLDVVRRLADAGGDVVGHGDDHDLEVIGWATCWDDGDDDAHRAVADFLISRGARHHIFSAIALNLGDEVRRIVAGSPSALNSRMSRSDSQRTPLHFAVMKARREMVALLLELGADPLAVDAAGLPVAAYASTPDIDRPVMEKIRAMTAAELLSAERGSRAPNATMLDLIAALALADLMTAERLVANGRPIEPGALHIMSARGDVRAVQWLLDHGASPNAAWAHADADVVPLHLAIMENHPPVVRLLLEAGADTSIRDSRHDGDAMDWARFFKRTEIERILEGKMKSDGRW